MPDQGRSVVNSELLAGTQPTISDGVLTLRRWTQADAPHLVTAFRDPDIRMWNLRTLESLDEALALVDAWKRGWRRNVAASWAVVPADASTVLGQVGFRSLFLRDGLAEVSYWVMPGHRGRGLATRSARLLADWGMKELALERIELVHSVHNPVSCRVAVSAGYQQEGIKRRLQQHDDGKRHDMCLHSRIREETPAAGEPMHMPLRIWIAARLERSVRSGDVAGRSVGLQAGG